MKKHIITLIALLSTISTLHAQTGEEIYTVKCISCHVINSPVGMQGTAGKVAFMKAFKALTAPPMDKVVMKVIGSYPDKKTFVNFVSTYITDPSLQKAVCGKRGIKQFGLMPPIGKSMTEEEKEKVSAWIFDTLGNTKVCKSCSACQSKPKENKDCGTTK